MKFSLSWLKDHLETNADAPAIATALTALGLEVEALHDRAGELAAFTVAEILETAPHPQADRLKLCKVNTGTETLSLVCGAPNARAGIKVVLAREGVTIPATGTKLKKSSIRGVESQGMLCSARELLLGADEAGIMELPAGAPLGASIVETLALNDPVFEIAITPNRADCLGVRGIARDLAASGIGTLKPLPAPAAAGNSPCPVTVTIAPDSACRHFVAVAINGVRNGDSPDWMKRRLESAGLRPISLLVDITNYVMLDLGRPLHAYDLKTLTGNITVRNAHGGEPLSALNGKHYELPETATVIADDNAALGVGGIIGGEASGCTENTTDMLLECAWFEPRRIAETGRALNLPSDARYRFERGVDPSFTKEGALHALRRILELAGGTATALNEAGTPIASPAAVRFAPAAVQRLSGLSVTPARMQSILEALGFSVSVQNEEEWTVSPPASRRDVEGSADIVEEIARVTGYDALPVTPLPRPTAAQSGGLTVLQTRTLMARRTLASLGCLDTWQWGFISAKQAEQFGGVNAELTLQNPISAELSVMRGSLLPHLIDSARKSAARGLHDVAFAETGSVFLGVTPEGQRTHAASLRAGSAISRSVHAPARPVDAFDAKADGLALLTALGIKPQQVQIGTDAPDWFHPGRSGSFTLGGKIVLGYFGELHPAVLLTLDAPERLVACEINLNALPEPKGKAGRAKPALALSDYQAVTRDFAFIADAGLPAAKLLKAVEGAEKNLIQSVRLFDVYQGKGVAEGKKSIALSVTLQAPDRTLTEAEITAISDNIVKAAALLGALLRQ